jgi:hypothetical protein
VIGERYDVRGKREKTGREKRENWKREVRKLGERREKIRPAQKSNKS